MYRFARLKVLSCVPSAVLSTRRPPSLDWVPMSLVPQRHEHYEGATTSTRRITGHLFVSRPVPTRFPPRFVLAAASAPERVEVPHRARIIVRPAIPVAGSLSRGREWDISGSQAAHPVPLPRSKTPAELTTPCLDGLISAAPASIRAKASADGYIEANARLQHLLSTLHERCCHRPCKTRFRLAG